MPEQVSRGFPLFPLGMVALPSESVPLHVFEDRYRRMIERCLQAEPGSPQREFGIVWLSDEELKEVGCACEVERVLERMDDGRLDIVARGTRPFRLLERQHDLPYPAGVIEFLGEPHEEIDPLAATSARELYRELVEQATDRQLGEDELALMSAYQMAATVEFDKDAKQELLELRSESAPAAAGDAAARGDQAAGADRSGAGARAVKRQGALRLNRGRHGGDRLRYSGRWHTRWAVCSTNSASRRKTCGCPAELSLKLTVPFSSRRR